MDLLVCSVWGFCGGMHREKYNFRETKEISFVFSPLKHFHFHPPTIHDPKGKKGQIVIPAIGQHPP